MEGQLLGATTTDQQITGVTRILDETYTFLNCCDKIYSPIFKTYAIIPLSSTFFNKSYF